jgi:hypothetical protein
MTLPDLFFLFSVLFILIAVASLLVALIARKPGLAKRIALGLAAYVVLYALALVTVSLSSPQQVLGMHQDRCFDDWCIAVVGVTEQPAIGASRAQGGEYALVTVRVSSRAQGIRQRAVDAAIYLLDGSGRRYDPSPEGQRALEGANLAGQPLNSYLDPGGSFTHTAAFDLLAGAKPYALVVTHGLFPGMLIIGDGQSFLHKPVIFKFGISF